MGVGEITAAFLSAGKPLVIRFDGSYWYSQPWGKGPATYMAERRSVRLAVLPVAGIWLLARFLEACGDGRHFYTHLAAAAGLVFSCAVLWALLSRVHSVLQIYFES
jgi:hypothetical protein